MLAAEFEIERNLQTPVGGLRLQVRTPDRVLLTASEPGAERLADLQIDGARIFEICFPDGLFGRAVVHCAVEGEGIVGPDCGERLDAISLESGAGWLTVGVRDEEALLEAGIGCDRVRLRDRGVTLSVSAAPVGFRLGVAAAWRLNRYFGTPEREFDEFWGFPVPERERNAHHEAWLAVDRLLPPLPRVR